MKILGTGSYVPHIIITNEYLSTSVGVDAAWVESKLGIKERRITHQGVSVMGVIAGASAIMDAGLVGRDIDMIIVATATPEKLNPSTASIIQDKLCPDAIAFDINAVCSGFVYALAMAHEFSKVYKHILVIGVDRFSSITDWEHRDCVFFGDGAGAVVINGGIEPNNNFWYKLGANGRGQCDFETEHGGTFKMNSKAVYNAGTTFLPPVINNALELAGITINDITWMLPHQASVTMLKEIVRLVGLPWERVKTNMEGYGNTAGASIPILLNESKNDFKLGDKILLASIGSGWAYGAIIIEW